MTSQPVPVPPDDLSRRLTVARPDQDQGLPHIGLVGDTYTILVTGEDTAGKYTLIDMHVPPGGGPPPHRHDFEEMFTVLDGEVQMTTRTQAPPPLDAAARAAFIAKSRALTPDFKTELLRPPGAK
jgi:quercetin dioxygenase-like cupin family protein